LSLCGKNLIFRQQSLGLEECWAKCESDRDALGQTEATVIDWNCFCHASIKTRLFIDKKRKTKAPMVDRMGIAPVPRRSVLDRLCAYTDYTPRKIIYYYMYIEFLRGKCFWWVQTPITKRIKSMQRSTPKR
jgi:hypothetical protein